MDQEILVKEAHLLTEALDKTKIAPRAVMITISPETGNWRIWIVPRSDDINKQEFYRIIAECISSHGLMNIDVGSVELRLSTNPAIIGMSKFLRAEGMVSIQFSSNIYKGILLPDGIVIRMAV